MKKPSAASRTVNLFQPAMGNMEQRAVEAVESDEKGDRLPLEADVNNLRQRALVAQEWSTKAFGKYEAVSNEFRVSKSGCYYYLETLAKQTGAATAYGYTGVVLHERDLMAATQVLVAAVRAKQAETK